MITPDTFKASLTGIAAMDFEHWHLLKQLDRAFLAHSFQEAQSRVDEFIHAWQLHHDHEDHLMTELNFPDAKAHMAGHARLQHAYLRLRHDALEAGHNLNSARAYIDMVAHLVRDHINQHDAQYAAWAKLHSTREQAERFGIGRPAII